MNYGKSLRFGARTGSRLVNTLRWGLALTLLLLTLPALAAETILSLGVLRDGKLDARVSRAVHERLTRSGETAPATSHLVLAERQCALPNCLDPLAQRENAQLVLSGRVQQSAGFSYIAAFLYDVAHQRSMDVSAVCDKCLPEALAIRVGDLYERLLHDYRDRLRAEAAGPRKPVKTATATAPSPAQTNPPAANTQTAGRTDAGAASQAQQTAASPPDNEPAERIPPIQMAPQHSEPLVTTASRRSDHSFALSPRRKLIAGILGGIGIATLVTAIALNATDGNATSRDCDMGGAMAKVCVLDNRLAYTVGYAVTGALAVGVGMTILWPESAKSNRTEVK